MDSTRPRSRSSNARTANSRRCSLSRGSKTGCSKPWLKKKGKPGASSSSGPRYRQAWAVFRAGRVSLLAARALDLSPPGATGLFAAAAAGQAAARLGRSAPALRLPPDHPAPCAKKAGRWARNTSSDCAVPMACVCHPPSAKWCAGAFPPGCPPKPRTAAMCGPGILSRMPPCAADRSRCSRSSMSLPASVMRFGPSARCEPPTCSLGWSRRSKRTVRQRFCGATTDPGSSPGRCNAGSLTTGSRRSISTQAVSLAGWVRGELPRPLPGRVPQPGTTLDTDRGARGRRGLPPPLQRASSTQQTRLSEPGLLRCVATITHPSTPHGSWTKTTRPNYNQTSPSTNSLPWLGKRGLLTRLTRHESWPVRPQLKKPTGPRQTQKSPRGGPDLQHYPLTDRASHD